MSTRSLRITYSSFKLLFSGMLFSSLLFLTPDLQADPLGAGAGVIYRLNADSTYQEGCYPPCLCPILDQRNVRGTYNVIYTGFREGIETYRIADINWAVFESNIPLQITGVGTYQIGSPDPSTVIQHRMILELIVADDAVARFDSGWIPLTSANKINITVSINGAYCWDRVISIFSSIVPADQIRHYSLTGGSTFQRGCFDPCDCILEPQLRMVGDFALVALEENTFTRLFSVVNVNWQVLSDSVNEVIPITGYGVYQMLEEFSVQHRLSLDLVVGNEMRAHLDSGWVVGGNDFPKMDAVVSINGIECYDTVLHVIAEPVDGKICGGLSGITCDLNTEFCKLPVGQCCCDFQGVCTEIPTACIDLYDPVCGCDGVTYGNECEADAARKSINHRGPCEIVCAPTDDGSACQSPSCSDVPEIMCFPVTMHMDLSDGALSVLQCDCMNMNDCHIEFGNATPFAVGNCADGTACGISGTDTNNDGIDDTFTAVCMATGACCSDIGGIPTPLPICTETTRTECEGTFVFFEGEGTTCSATAQACCLPYIENYCVDVGPECCAGFGGVISTKAATCAELMNVGGCGQVCGGISNIACHDPSEFCELPVGGCCCDFRGLCKPLPDGCPRVLDPVCGCDGVTYLNECDAHNAGMSIDHWGECRPVCCDLKDAPPCIEGPHCCSDGTWRCGEGGGTSPCEQPGEICSQVCGGFAGIQCENPGEFCKLPTGECCCDFQGVCTEIPNACVEIYSPVCGCNGMTYDNECFAEAAGISIDHDGICEACSSVRLLSDTQLSYCSGIEKTVHIQLHVVDSITAIAMEDTVPAGWTVTRISHDGTFDAANRKVKWGPLFAPFPVEVTYAVVPPSLEDGFQCFAGTLSLDGVDQPICGEECITRICCPDMPFMAADVPQDDCAECPVSDCTDCQDGVCQNGRLSLCEMTSYACAWKKGCNDHISGVARAAYIWRNGECYCWDDDTQNWFSTDCTADTPGCCVSGSIAALVNPRAELHVSEPDLSTVVARIRSDDNRRTRRVRTLDVSIDAPAGSTVMALEIQVPKGFRVISMSDGGEWDSSHRKIKWGPYFDDLSRTLSVEFEGYRMIPVQRTTRKENKSKVKDFSIGFVGTVSFDGNNYSIRFE